MFLASSPPSTLEEITNYTELCAYLAVMQPRVAQNAGILNAVGDEWHARAPGFVMARTGTAKQTLLLGHISTCFALTRAFPQMIEVERADLHEGYLARVHGLPALFHDQLPEDIIVVLAVHDASKQGERAARGIYCTNPARCLGPEHLFEALMRPCP